MPVEIKELVIKTVVDGSSPPQNQQQGAAGNSPAGNNDNLVALCVEQVLEVIKSKNER